jgi:peptidoglycan hydrolase CwlO-like protein
MEEMSDTSSDFLELFSEGSSENIIDALNSQVYELEQKVEYYKNKSHQQAMQMFKYWLEIEQQKQKIENLKSILMSKMPDYLHTIIKYL